MIEYTRRKIFDYRVALRRNDNALKSRRFLSGLPTTIYRLRLTRADKRRRRPGPKLAKVTYI